MIRIVNWLKEILDYQLLTQISILTIIIFFRMI
jgi:hypothetical protein